MARLPKPIPRDLIAELSLTEDGKAELASMQAERKARLNRDFPEPTIGDILEFKQRMESDARSWRQYAANVRRNRFGEDETPEKWRLKLSIPEDRRFRTNLTANEVNRVAAMMGRNPPKVNIKSAGSSDAKVQRAEHQASWSQQLLPALERDSGKPLWALGDDGASENGKGWFEWYITDRWSDTVDKLIEDRDPEVDDKELDKRIEDELKSAGLNFAVRYVDSMSGHLDYDEDGRARGLVVERKHYAQVYERLRNKLSPDEFSKAQLPPVAARSWPDSAWITTYGYMGDEKLYNGRPDDVGDVEVIRYYDRRWLVEVVAGKIVEVSEHHLPGVPLFRQTGKYNSNASDGFAIQGVVNQAMLTQELALNDLFTLAMDNYMTYGRPFPVVTTSENGAMLLDEGGMPSVIKLDDPSQPPQLAAGQSIVDAFGTFRGHIEPGFLQQIHAFWQLSGVNPIAQGESPGSDPSGYAINTLQTAGQALYESMLDNKARMLADIVDFSRIAVRDTIQETVYLTVDSADGKGVEFLGLSPDDVDEVPCEVSIDPMSDTQRMALTEWLAQGRAGGYVARRTVQTRGYGGVIGDPDDEDREILRDQIRQGLVPFMAQFIIRTVAQDAFPGSAPPSPGSGAPPSAAPGEPSSPEDRMRSQGILPADVATVGAARTSPVQAQAHPQPTNGRPGMPAQRGGVPLVG